MSDALDYARLAQQYRPTDPAALAAEVRRLALQGLTERDIGMALSVNPEQVRRALAATGHEAAALHAEGWK